MWFAAHVVMLYRYRDKRQRTFTAHDNVYLVRAADAAKAWAKAEAIGQAETAHDDQTTTLNGLPARYEFAGVRKVVECESPGKQPSDGTELTYNTLYFASRVELTNFLHGEPATVDCQD